MWGGREAEPTTPGQQAVSALVAIGSRSFTPVLNALRSPVWVARRNSAWALGAFRDSRAVPPLIDVLKDREPPFREQAAWALGALRDPRGVDALVSALKDQEAVVRKQAAW